MITDREHKVLWNTKKIYQYKWRKNTMKKLAKAIAAISAAAILTIPANMTASAYLVDTGKSFSNPLINYDFSAGRGQQCRAGSN